MGATFSPKPTSRALLHAKVRRYNFYFAMAAVTHTCIMFTYNFFTYRYILPFLVKIEPSSSDEATINPSANPERGFHAQRFCFNWVDYFAGLVAVLYFIYFLLCVRGLVHIARRVRLPHQSRAEMSGALQQVTQCLFPVSIAVYLLLKCGENPSEFLALSLSIGIGWIHFLLYVRAVRGTAFFSIMLNRLMFSDLLRFLCIIAIITAAFTMATACLFADNADEDDKSNPYTKYFFLGPKSIFLEYMRLAVGLSSFDNLLISHKYLSIVIYVCFVAFVNLLLFNMLIATMSQSYAVVSRERRFHCFKVRMADIILLEMILPRFLRRHIVRTDYKHLRIDLQVSRDAVDSQEVHLLEATVHKIEPVGDSNKQCKCDKQRQEDTYLQYASSANDTKL